MFFGVVAKDDNIVNIDTNKASVLEKQTIHKSLGESR
jgi:hypothetical protein